MNTDFCDYYPCTAGDHELLVKATFHDESFSSTRGSETCVTECTSIEIEDIVLMSYYKGNYLYRQLPVSYHEELNQKYDLTIDIVAQEADCNYYDEMFYS